MTTVAQRIDKNLDDLIVQFNKISLDRVSNAAIAVLFALFFAALLFYTPFYIQDYLSNAGWFYLGALGFFASILIFFRDQFRVPQKSVLILIGLSVLVLNISSLLNHSTFLEERWNQRYLGLMFFVIAFQIFRSELDISKYLRVPLSLFLLFVCLESIYQYLFLCQLDNPMGPSCYASRLWHINMLAQALVLSLPFLLVFRRDVANQIARWSFDVVIVLSSLTILLSGCRSSLLALGVFFLLQFVAPFAITRSRSILLFVASLMLFAGFFLYKQNTLTPFGGMKQGSAQYRLEVWKKTIEMAKDFPSGVGVNNFEFGFLPYKRESKVPIVTHEVDKSPHNEFVRVLAEEGWVVLLALVTVVGVFLVIAMRQLQRQELTLLSRFILIGVPEFFFQFPTELIFPVFLFVICCAVTFNTEAREMSFKRRYKAVLLITSGIVLALFVVRNSEIVPLKYSPVYCSLFPDNWKMCAEYFKSNLEGGDYSRASETIRPVIRRQPFNFIALHFDFLLGDPVRNSKISCNSIALFNGNSFIDGADTSQCDPSIGRKMLIENFQNYARDR